MITPPGLSHVNSTVPFSSKNDSFPNAQGRSNPPGEAESNRLPHNSSRALLSSRDIQQLSIAQRAEMLLNVDHNFHGVITTEDGDRLEFSSQLSFELSHQEEFELLARENQKSIERAYGLREPEDDEETEENGLSGAQRLDAMVPEFANSENTSQRIFDFARSMLPFFLASADRNGNNELTEENLEEFMEMMRDAIDEGFRQARDMIQGLSLMNEDLGGLIDLTYDKVQEKLDNFEAETREEIQNNGQQPEAEQQLGGRPVGAQITSSYQMNFSYEAETEVEYAA